MLSLPSALRTPDFAPRTAKSGHNPAMAVRRLPNPVSQFPGYDGFTDKNRPAVALPGRTAVVDRR